MLVNYVESAGGYIEIKHKGSLVRYHVCQFQKLQCNVPMSYWNII